MSAKLYEPLRKRKGITNYPTTEFLTFNYQKGKNTFRVKLVFL